MPRRLAIIGLLRPFFHEQPLNAADAAPVPDAMLVVAALLMALGRARLFLTGLLNEDDPGLGVAIAPAWSVLDLCTLSARWVELTPRPLLLLLLVFIRRMELTLRRTTMRKKRR